jgi:hypothetical protein
VARFLIKTSIMKKLFLAMVIFSWASVSSGCSDVGQSCTEIGCGSGVTFTLGKPASTFASGLPLTIEVCIDAAPCSAVTLDAKAGMQPTCTAVDSPSSSFASCSVAADGSVELEMMPTEIKDPTGAHEARVTIRDAADAVVLDKKAPASITVAYPNGEECGPGCFGGTVDLQP